MSDDYKIIWQKFFSERDSPLQNKFPGMYRALVVETNDPLEMRRLRVKVPALHNYDLAAKDCPWAVPAFDLGVKRAGKWTSPCIGDWVWIDFENGSPYALVWTGVASPTRRAFYPYASVHQKAPLRLDETGKSQNRPQDFDEDYLPKDGRPMSQGIVDRYGNMDLISSTGFYPTEHSQQPPPPDFDPVQSAKFSQAQAAPATNDPDVKHMSRVTKYGNMHIMADQGYWWRQEGNDGEFVGDALKDEQFEIKRWKYIQRLINEDMPDGDQRRNTNWTRYGHLIDMRDVGWAQHGPIPSKSRAAEYGTEAFLSKEDTRDERWIKIRTKGGMLRQQCDVGAHPQDDLFIKRPLIEEVGAKADEEDKFWSGKDMRWIRDVTRHGFKIVSDDRGSDPRDARGQESPRGNGVLIKGRRTGASLPNAQKTGDPRGFYWEFNENDQGMHTTWGTPLGTTMELNDATEYAIICSRLDKYSMPWKGVEENEFLRDPVRARDPEQTTHHMLLDLENEYIRFKTRAGRGDPPDNVVNPADALDEGQGLEARDGTNGDGAWTEVLGPEHRALWMSKKFKMSIWHGQNPDSAYFLIDDDKRRVVVRNDAGGKIQIYCTDDIEIYGNNVAVRASQELTLKAGRNIKLDAGNTLLTLGGGRIDTSSPISGPKFNGFFAGVQGGGGAGNPAPGGQAVNGVAVPDNPLQFEPTDRGAKYNQPSSIPDDEIEHKIQQ